MIFITTFLGLFAIWAGLIGFRSTLVNQIFLAFTAPACLYLVPGTLFAQSFPGASRWDHAVTISSLVIFAIFLMTLVLLSYAKVSGLREGVYSGTSVWGTSLPILATIGFAVVVLANLLFSAKLTFGLLNLGSFFSFPELLVLLVLSAFYTTRLGQSLAALCTSLILLRVGFRPTYVFPSGSGVSLLLMSSITVLVLGDHMPWLRSQSKTYRSGHVLRAVLLVALCVTSIGMTLLTLTRLPEFCGWVLKVFSKNLSETLSSALLCSIVVGWALVAIGQMRQILLFLLALPTLLLFAFIVGWTAPYLAAYLTLVATLAIATQERRIQPRIANHNGELTVVLFRDRAG